jgi:hypothetical protein
MRFYAKGSSIDVKDQVVEIFWQPLKVVKLQTKEMLYYPDMKVTLVEAEVTDVE